MKNIFFVFVQLLGVAAGIWFLYWASLSKKHADDIKKGKKLKAVVKKVEDKYVPRKYNSIRKEYEGGYSTNQYKLEVFLENDEKKICYTDYANNKYKVGSVVDVIYTPDEDVYFPDQAIIRKGGQRFSQVAFTIAGLFMTIGFALAFLFGFYMSFIRTPGYFIDNDSYTLSNKGLYSLKRIKLNKDKYRYLKSLYMSDNNIKKLPDSLVILKDLQSLDIKSNKFKEFPGVILEVSSLKKLNISENNIEVIPDEINKLTELEEFIGSNNIIKTVPSTFWELNRLKRLNISNNNISNINDNIKNLTELEELDLSFNSIEVIPDSVFQLTKLKKLKLQNNKIKNISDKIGGLVSLEELYINGNNLETLPSDITKLRNLKILNVSWNSFKTAPDFLFKMNWLERLEIDSEYYSAEESNRVKEELSKMDM